jgi:anti-sigma regulatory factor (Ser/Thr protein kinase)
MDDQPDHDRHPFVMRLLSEPRYLCAVRATVETLARQLGLGDEQAGRVVMAVDEAITNVIRHGYRGEPGRPIWLRVKPLNDDGRRGLQIVIEDDCEQVDPSGIQGRPLDEVRPGGLGVHIIREAMDEVRFDRRPGGRGMRVTMRKYGGPEVQSAKCEVRSAECTDENAL